MVDPRDVMSPYALMFGEHLDDVTLGEIDQAFRKLPAEVLLQAGALGTVLGYAFTLAFGPEDPRPLTMVGIAFGPVASELDSRGIVFPADGFPFEAAFESFKISLLSDDAATSNVTDALLATIRDTVNEAIWRLGPIGDPSVIGALGQVSMAVDQAYKVRTGTALPPPSDTVQSISEGVGQSPLDETNPEEGHIVVLPLPATWAQSTAHPNSSGSIQSARIAMRGVDNLTQRISVFICYAHEDGIFLDELKNHLSSMSRKGKIEVWHDREIVAGQGWDREISEHFEASQLIIMLISADFMASDYCIDNELKRAMEKQIDGSAQVIPVIIRPVDWKDEDFAELLVLPVDGKPVVDWNLRDSAWANVVEGIKRTISLIEPAKG